MHWRFDRATMWRGPTSRDDFCLVPSLGDDHDHHGRVSLRSSANFVLVVEKDAVFQQLHSQGVPSALGCLLVTGKGYPDVDTRRFVHTLAVTLHRPIIVLTDADPHGVAIYLQYAIGSQTMAHCAHELAWPEARWLGVLPSEIPAAQAWEATQDPTMPLLQQDRNKLEELLALKCWDASPRMASIKAELQGMAT